MAIEFGPEALFIVAAVIAILAMFVLHGSNWLFRSATVFAAEGFASVFGRTALVVGCGAIFARLSIKIWKYLAQPQPDIFHAVITAVPALIVLMLVFQSALALGVIVHANAFGPSEGPRKSPAQQ